MSAVPSPLLRCAALAFLWLAPAFDITASEFFRRWGTVQETTFDLGYDSNVYGRSIDEVSDGFAALTHNVKVSRRNSLTRLEFTGEVEGHRYFSEDDASYVDGYVAIDAAYPNDPEDVSFWRGRVYWRKATRSDFDAGRRLQPTSYGIFASGQYLSSPKLGFTGMLRGDIIDRTSDGYGRTRRTSLRAGITHAWHPELRWDLDYTASFARTNYLGSSDGLDQVAGVRVRGRVSPKITGELFAGVRHSSFSGNLDFSDTGPNFGADITWTASPQFSARLNLTSEYNFNAVGTATLRTFADLFLDTAVGHGWHAIIVISPGHAKYDAAVGERSDRYLSIGASLEYSRTDRFFARLAAEWASNDSKFVNGDVTRTVGKLQVGLRY